MFGLWRTIRSDGIHMKHRSGCCMRLAGSVPLIICALLCVTVVGCVHAVQPFNAPSQQKMQVQSSSPQEYLITVAGHRDYAIPADGRVILDIPRLERGCTTYLFDKIKITDSSPYDVPAVVLKRAGKTVQRFPLNELAKAPGGPGELPCDEVRLSLRKWFDRGLPAPYRSPHWDWAVSPCLKSAWSFWNESRSRGQVGAALHLLTKMSYETATKLGKARLKFWP